MLRSYAIVKNLHDAERRLEIKTALDAMLEPHSGWRVTIMASSPEGNEWQIKGENTTDRTWWRLNVILPQHRVIEYVVEVVRDRIDATI